MRCAKYHLLLTSDLGDRTQHHTKMPEAQWLINMNHDGPRCQGEDSVILPFPSPQHSVPRLPYCVLEMTAADGNGTENVRKVHGLQEGDKDGQEE